MAIGLGSGRRLVARAASHPELHGSTQPLREAVPSQESQKIPLHAQSSSVVQSVHSAVKIVEQMPMPAYGSGTHC